MKFEVMSCFNAEQISNDFSIDDCVIISITSPMEKPADINLNNPHIKAILRLTFDDAEPEDKNVFPHMTLMSSSDAKAVLAFINNHKDNVDKIIVHCFAGVSRSAAVCAALMLILNGDDMEIFDNPNFSPNMHCYRLILEKHGSYNHEITEQKVNHNIALWRKMEGLDD